MELRPENRMEQILAGENITPENRAEAFTKEAIDNAGADLPDPGAVGNVLTSTGDGWESAAPSGGSLPDMTGQGGKYLTTDGTDASWADVVADTYETVAEIAVGQMQSGGEEMPGLYIYSDSEAVAPALNANETYYLNAAENDSNSVVIDLDTTTLRFNASTGEGIPTPLDPNKNMFVVQWGENGLVLVADTDAISNTTVKILKKVSGGGSITLDYELDADSLNPVQNKVITAALADKMDADEIPEAAVSDNGKILGVDEGAYALLDPSVLSNDYKVTLTATVDEQTQQAVITADKSVAEIYAAAMADKHCFAVIEIGTGVYQRYELYLYSAAQVTFYGVEMDEEGGESIAKPVVIEGAHTGVDHDEWTVID